MANSLVEQFKTYKLFKSLSDRAGNVFTTVESYNAFMQQMQLSYQQGYALEDFEFALTLLESIAQDNATNFTAQKVDDKLKITPKPAQTNTKGKVKNSKDTPTHIEEGTETETDTTQTDPNKVVNAEDTTVKVNYEELIARAEKVFPTTQSYNDFVTQIDTALKAGESLSSFDFALTTFETLKASENSPYYKDELARIAQDPQFSTFATIAENLNVAYAAPLFTATREISEALEETTTLGVDTTIVATTPTEKTTGNIMSKVNQTNKIVLNVNSNGIVSNPEVLIGNGDGSINRSQVTTNKLEEAKLNALQTKVSTANSELDAQAIVDTYNTSLNSNTVNPVDISETYTGNADTGAITTDPTLKEVKDLVTGDNGTAIDIAEQVAGVSAAIVDAKKKLSVEVAEASTGSSALEGPTLEA